jgi:hypothetical protein
MKNPRRQLGCCNGVEFGIGRLRTMKEQFNVLRPPHCKDEPDWVL